MNAVNMKGQLKIRLKLLLAVEFWLKTFLFSHFKVVKVLLQGNHFRGIQQQIIP